MPPLPRSTCPVCGRIVPVRTNGALRDHSPVACGARSCEGTGQVPPSTEAASVPPPLAVGDVLDVVRRAQGLPLGTRWEVHATHSGTTGIRIDHIAQLGARGPRMSTSTQVDVPLLVESGVLERVGRVVRPSGAAGQVHADPPTCSRSVTTATHAHSATPDLVSCGRCREALGLDDVVEPELHRDQAEPAIEAPGASGPQRVVLPLEAIRTDGGTQARISLDPGVVLEYMDADIDGTPLPDVDVYYDGEHYWLADGFHRHEGRRRASTATERIRPEIGALVRQGSQRDAVLHAAGANASHGLRRSNADKRRAVMLLLEDEEWRTWSNRQISRHVGVTHPFVASLRRDLEDQGEQLELTERRGGVVTVTTDTDTDTDTTAPDEQLDLEEALRTLRARQLRGDALFRLEERVRQEITRLARAAPPVAQIEPGMLVVTGYETGPYVVQSVQDLEGGLSIGCRFLGASARIYLNRVHQLGTPAGAWSVVHGGRRDRLYLLRSPIDVSGLVDDAPATETARERRERRERGEVHPDMQPPAAGDEFEVPTCRLCGCTNADCSGCVERTGEPCWWVTFDVCSACEGLADVLKVLQAGDEVCVADEGDEWTASIVGGGAETIRVEWGDGAHMALCSRRTGHEVSPASGALPIRVLGLYPGRPSETPAELDEGAVRVQLAGHRQLGGAMPHAYMLGRGARLADTPDAQLDEDSPALYSTDLERWLQWRIGWQDSDEMIRNGLAKGHVAARETANDRTAPLRNGARALLDAYWTPEWLARACARWLLEHVPEVQAAHEARATNMPAAVEPSVGGGAWVRAIRTVLPGWIIDRVDIDETVPGLVLDDDDTDDTWVVRGDWLQPTEELLDSALVGPTQDRVDLDGEGFAGWSLCAGNRPYSADVVQWVDRCQERAEVVAMLERSTILGGQERWPWWQAAGRPAAIVNCGRVRWEGPGARDTGDFVDSYLIVWIRGHEGPTVYDWLDATAEAELAARLEGAGDGEAMVASG